MTNRFGGHIFFTLLLLSISCIAFAQGGHMQRMQQMRHQPNLDRRIQNNQPNVERRIQNNQNRPTTLPNPKQAMVMRIEVNFVHQQLALTPEQSAKFVPLYQQYRLDLLAVQKLKRMNNMDTQANGAEQIQKNLAYEQQIVDIKARYTEEFLKIMPPEKVSLIAKSERAFYEEILKQPTERTVPSATPPQSN